jgi:hypothetical protein
LSCADRRAQVLPPAGATVPPWLPAKSTRVSNLPTCYVLGPPASAAQYSCRREPCTGRSAWLPLGRACLSAWIGPRSGEQRSPSPGPQGAPARAQGVHRSFSTSPPPSLLRRPPVLLVTLSPATTACPPCVTFTCWWMCFTVTCWFPPVRLR